MGSYREYIVRSMLSISYFYMPTSFAGCPSHSPKLTSARFAPAKLTFLPFFSCSCDFLVSRNNARLAASCLSPKAARLSALLIVSFAYTLAQRLQQRRAEEPVKSLLAEQSPIISARVSTATNKPLECLVVLGEVVRAELTQAESTASSPASNIWAERTALETCIGELMDHLGACERLCTCHVPLSYSRHTTRLLSLFLLSLPLVLVGQPGGRVYTVPFVVCLTWALSGIDEVAHLIEDCFAGEPYSLKLDPLCDKIRRDLLEQVVPLTPNLKSPHHCA